MFWRQRVATRGRPENLLAASSSHLNSKGHIMSEYCVYIHKKATSGEIFYVGKSKGQKRSRNKSSRSLHWKRIEAKHGRVVEIVKDGLTNEEACALEIKLIAQIGMHNLVNKTTGGEGAPGRFVSKRTRAIVSEKNKGKSPSKGAINAALRKTRKPVVTLCGMRFESISAAARYIMPSDPYTAKISISSCCNGRRGQEKAYGLEFRFEVDGKPCEKHHIKPHVIFNSKGEGFSSPKEAGYALVRQGLVKNASLGATNIVSAINGRLRSAYGAAWWRSGECEKEYISPAERRALTIEAKKNANA